MNWLLSEAIMNFRYRRILIVAYIRKLKRVDTLGHYSDVHKICVYLKIKPNWLSKGALYRKMVQYGIKLSTKHPSESNNIWKFLFKISHFFFGKKYNFLQYTYSNEDWDIL